MAASSRRARKPMPKQWDPEKLKLTSRSLLKLRLRGFGVGIRIEIPFFVLVGRERRPRALAIAGVHGDEYEGVAALQDMTQEINPRELRGTLTIVPVANPQAFSAGTRRNPVDLGDLNRSFPGNPNGTMSERLAHLLFHEFVLGSDCILSLHCWSKEATVVPYVEYIDENTRVGRRSFSAAAALGLKFLHPYKWHPGLLVAAATRIGIPAIEPEVGGMGTVTAPGQRIYRSIVYRFLGHLKMLSTKETELEPVERHPKIIDHIDLVANYAGLFRNTVSAGQDARQGDLLGTIRDLSGKVLERIHAPRSGAVGILRTFASVQPGDRLVQFFWEKRKAPFEARASQGTSESR